MCWKRKVVQQPKEPDENLSKSMSSGIKEYVANKEEKLAGYLNRRLNRLTVKGQLYFLFAFCTLFGGVSLYLILNTFWGTGPSASSIQPKSIIVPLHKTGEENIFPGLLVTEEDIKELRAFKSFMDSLRLSAQGKPIYDSILTNRPGLMDTVSMLEQLYLLQQNK